VVKAERKPIEEIKDAINGYKNVLVTGCGGCVSICLAGGQREVNELNALLNIHFKKENSTTNLDGYTVERQCNDEFLNELEPKINSYDCVLSMACGAGVQNMAKRFPNVPVLRESRKIFDRALQPPVR